MVSYGKIRKILRNLMTPEKIRIILGKSVVHPKIPSALRTFNCTQFSICKSETFDQVIKVRVVL